jgi:hypothetical protein
VQQIVATGFRARSLRRHAPPVLAALCATVLVASCSSRVEPERAPRSAPRDATRALEATAIDAGPAARADASEPVSLAEAVAQLRAMGFSGAADVIARRAAQAHPKMKLDPEAALAAARALLEVAGREAFRRLHAVMPHSTVELARAVRERGVPTGEAEAIARYLVAFTRALAFERLAVFDENHSHVTGRDWDEIDYRGEGMTWREQQAYWSPRGVADFKRRAHIHAYFVGAERLPHWKRVYRPRGRVSDLALDAR